MSWSRLACPAALLGALGLSPGWAQTAAPAAPASAASAASATSAVGPAAAASAPRPAAGQRIEITGGRDSDTEARRRSTAAKIVIGREEIEKFGDATVGEVLRRLPGVTTPGAPGRGGPPRLRGLGSGYTQLLIDGQRVPPGFSLESLTPEQIERIEIQRAPTAETGARAIAGTINIITREGFRRRLNEVRAGTGYENGAFTPGAFWTRNDSIGDLIYNLSLGVFKPHRISDSRNTTVTTRRDTGAVVESLEQDVHSEERRTGVNLTGRLQWRLGEGGDSLMLMPTAFFNDGRTDRRLALQGNPLLPPSHPYEGRSDTTSQFSNLRVNGQWRQRLNPGLRMELGGHAGAWRSDSDTLRAEDYTDGTPPLRTDSLSRVRERSALLSGKFSGVAGGPPSAGATPAGGSAPGTAPAAVATEHSLVGGFEVETIARDEDQRFTGGSGATESEPSGTFQASTLRLAAYLQDEWNLSASWAFHAGLRWEGITTRGDDGGGGRPENRSSVTTPLLHLLWKPDPARRDQVRLSLTRSYRAPGTQSLIARPVINSRYQDTTQTNSPTAPDSVGNADLKPERAIGLDLAFERYLEGGGLLSANLFHRRIRDLIRTVTTASAQVVPWASAPRFFSRPENIGDATTQGLELEAKYRLDQLIGEAPRVELRHNLALFRSRVEGVPGPDNRLDQQARLSANLGADYRLRGLPITLGGNLNWVPGYRTQLDENRVVVVSGKRVLDGFVLWTVDPALGIRLLASNLAPRDYSSRTEFSYADAAGTPLLQSAESSGPSYLNWQLRFEFRL